MRQLWKNCQGTTQIFQEVHIRAKRWPWHWNQLSSPQCPTTLPFACMQVVWIPLWYQQNQISESAAFPQQFALRFRQIHLMLPTWWWKRWRKHCKMVFSVRCFNNLRFFSSRWICWWKGSIQEAGTKRKLQSLIIALISSVCTYLHILILTYTPLHLSNRSASNEHSKHRCCFLLNHRTFQPLYSILTEASAVHRCQSAEISRNRLLGRQIFYFNPDSNDQDVNCHPFIYIPNWYLIPTVGIGLPHKPSPMNGQGVYHTFIIILNYFPKSTIFTIKTRTTDHKKSVWRSLLTILQKINQNSSWLIIILQTFL